jgi:hypothetical protein
MKTRIFATMSKDVRKSRRIYVERKVYSAEPHHITRRRSTVAVNKLLKAIKLSSRAGTKFTVRSLSIRESLLTTARVGVNQQGEVAAVADEPGHHRSVVVHGDEHAYASMAGKKANHGKHKRWLQVIKGLTPLPDGEGTERVVGQVVVVDHADSAVVCAMQMLNLPTIAICGRAKHGILPTVSTGRILLRALANRVRTQERSKVLLRSIAERRRFGDLLIVGEHVSDMHVVRDHGRIFVAIDGCLHVFISGLIRISHGDAEKHGGESDRQSQHLVDLVKTMELGCACTPVTVQSVTMLLHPITVSYGVMRINRKHQL